MGRDGTDRASIATSYSWGLADHFVGFSASESFSGPKTIKPVAKRTSNSASLGLQTWAICLARRKENSVAFALNQKEGTLLPCGLPVAGFLAVL